MTAPNTLENQAMNAENLPNTAQIIKIHPAESLVQVQPSQTTQHSKPVTNSSQRRQFKYAGRTWILRRRGKYWHLDNAVRGRRLRVTLATDAALLAEGLAKREIDQFFATATKAPIPRATSSLGELFSVVGSLDMVASPTARRTYVWGTAKFVAFALDLTEADVSQVKLSALNGELAEAAFTKAIAHALALPDQPAQNKFRRQVASWFNCAKALFARDSVRSMPGLGITPPAADALAAFRAGKPKRFKVHKASEFIPPAPAILRNTMRQWIKLGRTPGYAVLGGRGNSKRRLELQPLNETFRRNMFIAIGLMIACGLRKNEVRQIRWRHLGRDANHVPRLTARDVKVKRGDGEIDVKPLDPFWRILNRTIDRHGWRGAPDDYVLAERPKTTGHHQRSPGLEFSHGGPSDRLYWPFYHIGKWLRSLGWNLQKTNHALRDCAGSLVTMKFGLLRAKKFCRHEQFQTTEAHYNKFVDEDTMDDPRKLAWLRWAK